MSFAKKNSYIHHEVAIRVKDGIVHGDLVVPPDAKALVIFAHGSGSSRKSPRNQFVAKILEEHGLATLLFDLLTPTEDAKDAITGTLRFDISFLAKRLQTVMVWVKSNERLAHLSVGYFGASTGAAAALKAAAHDNDVYAVVSRGGRPDLAMDDLPKVSCPTLLIVGGDDTEVIKLNKMAQRALNTNNRLEIVPNATHLFEEPGTLEQVAELASAWFLQQLDTL